MWLKMFNICMFALLFVNHPALSSLDFSPCQCPDLAPKTIGKIEDQFIFLNGTDCGKNDLCLDITPYFETYGNPVSYCLSRITFNGDISHLQITLDPFSGLLKVPVGAFGVTDSKIQLKIIAKNSYGSATQTMTIMLVACGG